MEARPMSFKNIPPGYLILIMFLSAQILGTVVGILLTDKSPQIKEFQEMAVTPVAEKGSMLNTLFFFGYILVMAVVLYFGIKVYKGVLLFRVLEFLVITFATSIVFFVLLTVAGLDPDMSMLAGIAIGLLIAIGKNWLHPLRNAGAIISSGGVGAIFGFSLGFIPSLLFAVLLSIYDYIAVFKTKHMVKFAETFTQQDLAFTIAAGPKPSEKEKKELEKIPFEERVKKIKRTELGTGDLVIPVVLSVSVYPVLGLVGSLCVIFFTTLALYAMMRYHMTKKQVLPALPPITAGAIVGMVVAYILNYVVLII